jgi:hypothetical protein
MPDAAAGHAVKAAPDRRAQARADRTKDGWIDARTGVELGGTVTNVDESLAYVGNQLIEQLAEVELDEPHAKRRGALAGTFALGHRRVDRGVHGRDLVRAERADEQAEHNGRIDAAAEIELGAGIANGLVESADGRYAIVDERFRVEDGHVRSR